MCPCSQPCPSPPRPSAEAPGDKDRPSLPPTPWALWEERGGQPRPQGSGTCSSRGGLPAPGPSWASAEADGNTAKGRIGHHRAAATQETSAPEGRVIPDREDPQLPMWERA